MKLDILAFGAHPDDVEMSCGGTLALAIAQDKKVGIVDMTRGELGTRGNAKLRKKESDLATQILGASVRHNLGLEDGNILNDKKSRLKVIEMIRCYQPDIVFCNAMQDRHPDHPKAAQLVREAFFLSGLPKVETKYQSKKQTAWRPFHLFHYVQDMEMSPDFYVDISDYWQIKKNLVNAYASQFHTPFANKTTSTKNEPQTYISTPHFMEAFDARYRYYGKKIGTLYAEPFCTIKPLGVKTLDFLIHAPF